MIRPRINPETLEWGIYVDDARSSEFIVKTLTKNNMDPDPYTMELAWGESPFLFNVGRQFAKLFLSSSDIKDPKFYVREKDCKVGFSLGPESTKYLLGDALEPEGTLYKDIIAIADRALYKYEAKRFLKIIVLMEAEAAKKKQRTFTVYKLLEEYDVTPRFDDLKGGDKVVYDYLSSRTYKFEIKKRLKGYYLRVVSYPKIHIAKEIPLLKIPA